ncbi:patatin-like phospholipase family protein [Tropicimonas sp.]|uniref:patatin-like phospholipase family protein n=1 Tax=Tropicimonas sp. TaxID=2067044 RepID=UPI003A8C699C
MHESLLDILSSRDIQSRLERVRVMRGERLIRQGSPSSEIYFIAAGRFRVERDGHSLGDVDSGSVIGEIAFFTGVPRTATVTASRDSLVFRLNREDYDRLCDEFPRLRDAITTELSGRIANSHKLLSDEKRPDPSPRTIVPLATGDAFPVDTIISRLASALAVDRPIRVITHEVYLREMGRTPPGSPNAIAWFCANENPQGVTLYVPDPADGDWTRAILRHADEVLLIGTADDPPPGLSAMESFAFEQVPQPQRRLMLVHPARRISVSGTAEWLASRPVRMHHHVALADNEDIRRVARFVNGTAVGLVCSGGGAFGPAHAGVWAAFSRAGGRFDIVGGTSAGSAMTGAFVLGMDTQEIGVRVDDIFVRNGALRRATVPKYALIDHVRLDELLKKHFTAVRIEDLWLPYFAVATNLTTNATEIMRTGPLWIAIRASSAIPGVLPPYLGKDGSILVDGGMLDNLPVGEMRQIKTGPNVISSLERWKERRADLDYDDLPGRWDMLRDLVNPFKKPRSWAPGITETLVRSMMASQFSRRLQATDNEILLRPPMPPNMDLLSWRNYQTVMDAADRYTEDVIARADPADIPAWARVIPGMAAQAG